MTDSKLRSGALAALVTCFAVSANTAAAESFVLEGYEGMAPRLVSTGRYEEIIAQTPRTASLDARRAARATTNLCVAYIKTARLEPARTACDAAITAARRNRQIGSIAWSAQERWQSVARAYSNRAVLNWVNGDRAAAAADLMMAAQYAPHAHFVVSNTLALAERSGPGSALAARAES